MKTAIYIVEGTVQIVLTPENDHEKNVVKLIGQEDKSLRVMQGSFYSCQGGWYRHSSPFSDGTYEDKSIIIRLDDKKPEPIQEGPHVNFNYPENSL